VHTIGIDRAVNAGFLGRLAAAGAGRTELVESEDRLDEAMEQIHRRIGAPVVTDLVLSADGFTLVDGTRAPHRLPGLYPGVPLVVSGRYRGAAAGTLTVTGRTRDDQEFRTTVEVTGREEPAIAAQWARGRLLDLQDRYAAGDTALEQQIVATSLRFGVLCRFTAYVAVDSRVVNENGETRRVTQPVEMPSGWDVPAAPPMLAGSAGMMLTSVSAEAAPPMRPGRFAAPRAQAPGGAPKPFAAIPASVARAGSRPRGVAHGDATLSAQDIRDLAKVEARRLHEGQDRPAYERRDMLADLLSRLEVLVGESAEPELAPLRALIAHLAGDADLETRWAEARRVLDGFAGGGEPERKAFWKR
jgi:Ca-activated chloride channel family protein